MFVPVYNYVKISNFQKRFANSDKQLSLFYLLFFSKLWQKIEHFVIIIIIIKKKENNKSKREGVFVYGA